MTKLINEVKKYIKDNTKRKQHALITTTILTLFVVALIFTGGRKEKLIKNTLNYVEAKSSSFINNHEYKELPWDILLTKEDKDLLAKEDIPKLPELNIKEQDVMSIIETFSLLAANTTNLIKDQEIYADSLDNKTILEKPLYDIYGNSEVYSIYRELLNDIYSKNYTFPDEMALVSIKQEMSGPSEFQWITNFELRALQDSSDYLVYPITLTFDKDYRYMNGAIGVAFESPSGTRPLNEESVIYEDSHKSFVDKYNQFSMLFNKNASSGKTDTIHLNTMATEDISIDLLTEMYESSRGDLANASITSWEMNDKKAEATSNYRLDIPKNSTGEILSINIEYSRPYDEILSMNYIN